MNNYCRNCGEKLTNRRKCEKCGTDILNKRMGELDKKLARKYIIIFFSIIAFFIFSIIGAEILGGILFYSLYNLLPIGFIVFTITAKVQLKYSKFFNIVFWLMLFGIVATILFILYIIVSCQYQF